MGGEEYPWPGRLIVEEHVTIKIINVVCVYVCVYVVADVSDKLPIGLD